MGDWNLEYDAYEPGAQGLREALCTLGNGVFCTRGAFTFQDAADPHYPGTYLAGGYNRLTTRIADRDVVNEDLVNFPNWLCLTFRPSDGDWLAIDAVEVLAFRQSLDLARGLLTITLRVRDGDGRETELAERRFVSMANPHVAAIELTLTPVNWGGRIEVASALDGRVTNTGVKRYRELDGKHLEVRMASHVAGAGGKEDVLAVVVETIQSGLRVGQAARTRLFRDGARLDLKPTAADLPGCPRNIFTFEAAAGQATTVEKVVGLYSSKDQGISEPGLAALEQVVEAAELPVLLDAHERAWASLWRRFDVEVEADAPMAQLTVRLHIFHTLQTLSFHTIDIDAGTPARGWHGEAYRGHVFWDEIFILPFLDTHAPAISRALLRYRYLRLPKARSAAVGSGSKGAVFPWQSGSDGREESQLMHLNPQSGRWVPDFSWQQRHVNLAIAYNMWSHYERTGDQTVLEAGHAETIIEIARLFASLAQWNPEREGGRYEIHDVMGPDEFHEGYPDTEAHGLRNNAYTNVMASWLLRTAKVVLDVLDEEPRRELIDRIGLTSAEIEAWDEIARRLFVPFHGDGIISQFEGYADLKEFDWEGYRAKYGRIQRLDRILEAEGDSADRYKLAKQADALMLFYLFDLKEIEACLTLLGYSFSSDQWLRNVDYYLERTSHGSTLSFLVHAWVLARQRPDQAWEYLLTALSSDISDIQGGTTAEGIHLGLMAGTVDLLQRGLTGLKVRDGQLVFDPRLVGSLKRIATTLEVLGGRVRVEVTVDSLTLLFDSRWRRQADTIAVEIAGKVEVFEPGVAKTVRLTTN